MEKIILFLIFVSKWNSWRKWIKRFFDTLCKKIKHVPITRDQLWPAEEFAGALSVSNIRSAPCHHNIVLALELDMSVKFQFNRLMWSGLKIGYNFSLIHSCETYKNHLNNILYKYFNEINDSSSKKRWMLNQ